ncbi:MAG: hypothetical protein M3Z06_14540 [Actinomycetota bacterium]|nr:hypothetical protein [Actinomycetota bacterium]
MTVDRLSVRLAQVACDLEDVVRGLAAERPTEWDTILLAAPAAHLAIVVDALEQTLYELETRGQSPWPPIAAAEERLAA